MDLELAQALDGLSTLTLPAGSEVAQLTFGDQLRGSHRPAWRHAAGHTPVDPQVDVGYHVDLPILIDLSPAATAADDPTPPSSSSSPRWSTSASRPQLQDGAEADLTASSTAAPRVAGQIGFVPATVGGTYKLKQDGTEPDDRRRCRPGQRADEHAAPGRPDGRHRGRPCQRQPGGVPGRARPRGSVVVDADLTVNGHGARAAGRADRHAGHVHRRRHRPRPDVVRHRAHQRPGATAEGARRRHRPCRRRLLGRIIDTAGRCCRLARATSTTASPRPAVDGPKIPLIEQTAGGLLARRSTSRARSTRCAPARRRSTWPTWRPSSRSPAWADPAEHDLVASPCATTTRLTAPSTLR